MIACAQWMSTNALCKAHLGQQCSFPYTDYQEVRVHRYFAYIRDNKTNPRRQRGSTPAKYHELILDAGFKDGAKCPEFIKSLNKDEIRNGRVSSISMILTIVQLGGCTIASILHPNSWANQIWARHHRRLAQLEDEDNPTEFSGDANSSDITRLDQ